MKTFFVNVRDFGATGDGKTDDTLALCKAIKAAPSPGGIVFFPPGHYLTETIMPKAHQTLLGYSAFGYRCWPFAEQGGTVLSPFAPSQTRLLDVSGQAGIRLSGLTLNGRNLGENLCGVYSSHDAGEEQHIVIDGCSITQFSGSGAVFNNTKGWSLRHSIFMANQMDGLDAAVASGGSIIDCLFSFNSRHGLSLNQSTSVTGCRIEQNKQGGVDINPRDSQHLQFTGNLFCSEFGPSIEISEGNVSAIVITGNTFRNSGRDTAGDPTRDCHVRFEGMQGLVFTGNALHILWCDNPSYGMVLRNLKDSVIAHNSLFKGAMKELIRDLGGHVNTVIENNPGSLKDLQDLDS
jgi:hypothetical protein